MRMIFAAMMLASAQAVAAPLTLTRDADGAAWSAPAAEGNYRVTVVLGGKAASETTVKAEQRRLMLDAVAVPRGRTVTRSFIVNVRDAHLPPPELNAPGGDRVRLNARETGSLNWDDRLSIEVLGKRAAGVSASAEAVTVPTVFLLGDSTVTDQRYEPGASWGQMLTAFFKPDIAVANHAESGETLKSFLTGLRLDKVLSEAKPGDFALIQFGHNDQKAQWPQTYVAPDSTYRSYLKTYIAEFRRRGVTPVLVTSPERRNWNGATIRPTMGVYAAAMKAVAAEEKVPLIDLNAMSTEVYQALGPERAPLAFSAGGKDPTHHNNYGAWVLARAVAGGMTAVPELAAHLQVLAPFDPAKPPAPESFRLAPSMARSSVRPAGN